jgi:hypothetical protein
MWLPEAIGVSRAMSQRVTVRTATVVRQYRKSRRLFAASLLPESQREHWL